MRHAVPFAQVLDDAVAAANASSVRRPAPASALPRAIGFFEFTIRGAQPPRIAPLGRSTYDIVAEPRPLRASPDPAPGRGSFATSKRTRRLTRVQQRAVDDLVSLGARLGAEFTIDELRGAYRQLARRYHPDLHPGSTDGEKARLNALFSKAHDSYHTLLRHDLSR